MGIFSKAKITRRSSDGLSKLALQEERAAYLFLSPWLIGLIVFTIGPILASIAISMTDWGLITTPKWVGLENYQDMLTDRNFIHSIKVTLRYTVIAVPTYSVAGLALAMLLNQKVKGINVFRTILYLPSLLAGVAVAVIWASLLAEEVGVVNQALMAIGVSDPPRWLGDPYWAVPAIVLVGLWGIGGGAIIYLAGLQNIPPHLYEAAEIDGANDWQKFWNITLPMLTPTIFFMLITTLIDAFQVFDVAYLLGQTRRGIGTGGRSLLFYIVNLFNEGFRSGKFGFASALAWVLVVIAAISIIFTFRTAERWVFYASDTD
ncbi:MAG: sugar ABC transporter permease [Chloroflexi bacterium]|nr:sugar ABC transporter permease [Chloroflexota bacterium]